MLPWFRCLPLLASALLLAQAPGSGALTTVVIVRHAEKADDRDPDSPLSEAGRSEERRVGKEC